MRHGKKHNHLGRKTAHRHAMLSNMAASLILHKRISTTVAKAKALRIYAEPLITKAKEDNTHNRRMVFSLLQSKEAVTELFGIVSEKVASRPGGYTRIIKLANRLGDNAEMCLIELVDFNEVMLATTAEKPTRTRRSRKASGGSTSSVKTEVKPAAVVEEVTEVAEEVATPEIEAATDSPVDETPDASPEEKTEE